MEFIIEVSKSGGKTMTTFKDGFLYSKCYFVEGFLRQCSSEALYYSWGKHHRLVPDNYNFLRL